MNKPTTAVIIFGRNDGYKEKERGIVNLTTMLDTFDEVIYVDWNSASHSFLYEIIDQLPKTGRLKHYVISPEHAQMITNYDPDAIPCQGVFPQNIALRRCKADWVVFCALDIIPPFKEELENFLSKANEDTFYTFSRRETDYDQMINNFNNNNLIEYRKYLGKTTEPRRFPAMVTPNDHYSLINCCGDFQLASRKIWHTIKGVEEKMIYSCFSDTNTQKKAVLNGFGLEAVFDIPLYHMSHAKNTVPQGGDLNTLHEITNNKPPKFNDAWEWVEWFEESQNDENWGLGNVEIEYEII
jgi:hypothetical protein